MLPMIMIRALAGFAFAVVAVSPALAKEEPVSFAEDVFPILQTRCQACHVPGAEGTAKSGLDLTGYDGLMKGTKHGAMVVAGDPLTSNLMVLIDGRADKSLQMPHGRKKLSQCDRDLIRKWIKQGAKNN
ncbi:MAG: hypothetical protein HY985_11035 [Magnetospirillum sp.]|nr:hypothetical protein [Magnetospirillum sp.]